MSEEPYKQFDARMKLADFRRQYREARRSTEWRVTLAAWALLAGLVATIRSYHAWQAVAAAAVIVILHFLWVRWNFDAAERDARRMWAHFDAARKIVGADEPEMPSNPRNVFRHFPAFAAVVVSAMLAVAVIALLLSGPTTK